MTKIANKRGGDISGFLFGTFGIFFSMALFICFIVGFVVASIYFAELIKNNGV